jgi:hypothetical protein
MLLFVFAVCLLVDIDAFKNPRLGIYTRKESDLALDAKRRIKASTVKRRIESEVEQPESWTEGVIIKPTSSASTPLDSSPSREASRKSAGEQGNTLSDETLRELLRKDNFSVTTKSAPQEQNGIIATVKNGFASVLIADFFVVIAFLLW